MRLPKRKSPLGCGVVKGQKGTGIPNPVRLQPYFDTRSWPARGVEKAGGGHRSVPLEANSIFMFEPRDMVSRRMERPEAERQNGTQNDNADKYQAVGFHWVWPGFTMISRLPSLVNNRPKRVSEPIPDSEPAVYALTNILYAA